MVGFPHRIRRYATRPQHFAFLSKSIEQAGRRASISRQQIIINMHIRPLYLALILLAFPAFAQAQYATGSGAQSND